MLEIRRGRSGKGFIATYEYGNQRVYRNIEELLRAIYQHFQPSSRWEDKIIIEKLED